MLALLPAQHKSAEAEAEALTPGLLQTVGQLFQWHKATQHMPKREPIQDSFRKTSSFLNTIRIWCSNYKTIKTDVQSKTQ